MLLTKTTWIACIESLSLLLLVFKLQEHLIYCYSISKRANYDKSWSKYFSLSVFYGNSPILEISQEWGGTSFATFSQDPVKCFNDPEISRAVERPETLLEEGGNKAHGLQLFRSFSVFQSDQIRVSWSVLATRWR